MIVFLRGRVHRTGSHYVDLDVSGVGYRASVPDRDRLRLNVDDDVLLYTHHHVREDDESLYGFLQEADKDWFELLLTVSGIGPKVAIQIVSATDVNAFTTAITFEDAGVLSKLPGIGKKTAERLILELKDKLGTVASMGSRTTGLPSLDKGLGKVPPRIGMDGVLADVVEALQALGYNERQAMEAVTAASWDEEDLALEEAIKRCLAYFDTQRAPRRVLR